MDKLLHLLAGMVLGMPWAIPAGIGKEVLDLFSGRGDVEFLDFLFTVLGGIITWVLRELSFSYSSLFSEDVLQCNQGGSSGDMLITAKMYDA